MKNALKAGSVGCWLQMGRWAWGQVLCKNWQKCHQCIRDRNYGSPGQEVTEGWQCAWLQLVPDWAIAFSLCAWGRWWQSACQGEFLQFGSGLVLMVFKIFTLRNGPPGWLIDWLLFWILHLAHLKICLFLSLSMTFMSQVLSVAD